MPKNPNNFINDDFSKDPEYFSRDEKGGTTEKTGKKDIIEHMINVDKQIERDSYGRRWERTSLNPDNTEE